MFLMLLHLYTSNYGLEILTISSKAPCIVAWKWFFFSINEIKIPQFFFVKNRCYLLLFYEITVNLYFSSNLLNFIYKEITTFIFDLNSIEFLFISGSSFSNISLFATVLFHIGYKCNIFVSKTSRCNSFSFVYISA